MIAPKPPQVLPKSNASPRLLATLMTLKYVDGLPLARAEHLFKRSGVSLLRQTQARLIIQAAEKLQPIANLARDHALESPFIHMDETPVQVLKEPGRAPQTQSYMWVQTAGPPGRKIVLFDYETSREGKVPDRLLAGYSGYLMTDGYAAYDRVGKKDGMTHLACWAHASALIYSLVETAKGCGVDPYCWLVYVLKRLALAQTADDYEALLPWSIHPQDLAIDHTT